LLRTSCGAVHGMEATRYIGGAEGTRLPRQRVRLVEVFECRSARKTLAIRVVSAMTFGAQVAVTVFTPTLLVSRGLDVSTALVHTMLILLDTTTFIWAPELHPTRVRAFGIGAMVTVVLPAAAIAPPPAGAVADATGAAACWSWAAGCT
jgi:hypothetical protein